MSTITVLGAGAMGSALCTPVARAGWDVRLWGTWLDDHLLDALEAGRPHPRTNAPLPSSVALFRSDDLEAALDGADVVVMAVASVGVPRVTEMALDGITRARALWLTSKGFSPDAEGRVQLLPDAIRRIAGDRGLPPIVAIAGPVKANECGVEEPTATIFGCRDLAVAQEFARMARTDRYAIAATDDEVGVEICAPMKNIYAIPLGAADGLEERTGVPHHNLKAAAFARAVEEMSLLGRALGARPETAFGLAGVGDLEVTGLSGRNKVYGTRLGRGEGAAEALEEMTRLEQTVEDVPAVALATRLVEQSAPHLVGELRLLAAVARLVAGGVDDPQELLIPAVLPARP